MSFFYMQKLKSVQVDRLAHNNLCNCEQIKAPLMRCLLVLVDSAVFPHGGASTG